VKATVLVPHAIAVALLVALAWFVRQPISGDIALWSPAFATFLAGAIAIIAAGLFAWWRWGSLAGLVIADILALLPVGLVSIVFVFIPLVVVGVLLLAGIVAARSDPPVASDPSRRRPRPAPAFVVLVIAIPVAVYWWYAFTSALGFVGPYVDYGLPDAVLGGSIGLAILLWLDGRPGALAGLGVSNLYAGVMSLTHVLGVPTPEPLVDGILLIVPGAIAVIVSARDIRARSGVARLLSLGVSLGSLIIALVEPLLAPVAIAAAIVIEPSELPTIDGASLLVPVPSRTVG
jgi:hypothetical protein